MATLPVPAFEGIKVIRNGRLVSPMLVHSARSSKDVGWDGLALEVFENVPSSTIPDHEHPTHYLNLITSGHVTAEWKMDGHVRKADHGPGTLYLLPAGSRDVASWSGSSGRIVITIQPRLLAATLDETAHLSGLELAANWSFQDRHIEAILNALHADLEDGSPAGPLYGQSLSVALTHCLIKRYAVRTVPEHDYRNGIPQVRLNRVLEFMRENCGREIRLWELANVAGMSPHYFCELFKKSTGQSPYQYSLRCRIDRARDFLRDRRFTIGQVAVATGFSDQSHFTKVFRRVVGLTPMEFRR